MDPVIQVLRVPGTDMRPWLEHVARLRIAVFRDFPYLYDGNMAYEREYLEALSQAAGGALVLALDDHGTPVGASTGMPLQQAEAAPPDGQRGYQDKMQLTGFEKQLGVIEPGDALQVFDLGDVRAGIAVCYDSEFPLSVRAQREAGERLLLVPSCTDTYAGATRVTVGCMARALENRMFVAKAVTAGETAWSPALEVNTGEAVLYAPMDRGFPSDGVLAATVGDQLWAMADLDFEALTRRLGDAQVTVDGDWGKQRSCVSGP